MLPNNQNYFSAEMQREYMSCSQFKAFMSCPAAALAEINGEVGKVEKDCFTEGHLFEAIVNGEAECFYMEHPEIISSRGETRGSPKSNFLKAINAAEAIRRQQTVMEIVNRCKKQLIVTGEINGVPYKGCIDLYDPVTGDYWDTKCMRSFDSVYSPAEGRRLEWWENYGYHYQLAIYRELLLQTFGAAGKGGLIAATKEDVPDVAWLTFDDKMLDAALDIVYELSPTYQAMKKGLIDADGCGTCNFCKSKKVLTAPEVVTQYAEVEDDA